MPKGQYGGKMSGGGSKMRGMGAGGMMPGKKGKYGGSKMDDGLKGGVFSVRDKGMSAKGNRRTRQVTDRFK